MRSGEIPGSSALPWGMKVPSGTLAFLEVRSSWLGGLACVWGQGEVDWSDDEPEQGAGSGDSHVTGV